jgi:sulfur carrier protein
MGYTRGRPHIMQLRTAKPSTSIELNGESLETEARTLAELVAGQGFAASAVATAVNGTFVSREARAARLLARGDKVEIVAPRQGG